jgi:hypothetical protein
MGGVFIKEPLTIIKYPSSGYPSLMRLLMGAKTAMDIPLSKASGGGFIGNRCRSKDVTVSEFHLR